MRFLFLFRFVPTVTPNCQMTRNTSYQKFFDP